MIKTGRFFHRAAAFSMALAMTLSSLPMFEVAAVGETDKNNDQAGQIEQTVPGLSFSVFGQEEGAVKDADIKVWTQGDSYREFVGKTGENGVWFCPDFAELKNADLAPDWETEIFEYTVSKDGYISSSGDFKASNADWNATVSVTLEPKTEFDFTGFSAYIGTYDGEAHDAINLPEDLPDDVTLKYKVKGGDYSEDMPRFTNVCKRTVWVKATGDNYIETTGKFAVEIGKKNIDDFRFEQPYPADKYELPYQDTIGWTNKASSNECSGEVTYSSSNPEAITVNDDGTITVNKITESPITITAVMSGGNNYNDAIASYNIVVRKGERQNFVFDRKEQEPIITYSEGLTFENSVKNMENDSPVVYTVDDPDVADIDSKTGDLSIKKAGTVKVTATAEGNEFYNASSTEYTLTILKAKQNPTINLPENTSLAYGNELELTLDNNNKSTGRITYKAEIVAEEGSEVEKPSAEDYIKIENSKITWVDNCPEIPEDGLNVKISAVIAEDDRYEKTVTEPVTLKLEKAEQTINVQKEDETTVQGNIIEIGSVGRYTLNVTSSDENASISCTKSEGKLIKSVECKDGVITINFNYENQGEQSITITSSATDTAKETTVTITINVSAAAINYAIDPKKPNEKGWYNKDVVIKPDGNDEKDYDYSIIEVVKSEDDPDGNGTYDSGEWLDRLEFVDECKDKVISFRIKRTSKDDPDSSNFYQVDNVPLNIDKTAPEVTGITFGEYKGNKLFGNGSVKVTATAYDALSGIERFAVTDSKGNTLNVKDSNGNIIPTISVKDSNGNTVQTIEEGIAHEQGEDGSDTATVSFYISPEYEGKIKVIAYDNAGNSSAETESDAELALETTAPEVEVKVNGENPVSGSIYGSAEITVEIKEKHFSSEKVTATLEVGDIDEKYTPVADQPEIEFEYDEKEGKYVGKYPVIDPGRYKFTVECTDLCGNFDQNKSKKEIEFNIFGDITAEMKFADESEGTYFIKGKSVNIFLDTENLPEDMLLIECTAKDINGNDIGSIGKDLTDQFKGYIGHKGNWKRLEESGIYTIREPLQFDQDGRYTLKLKNKYDGKILCEKEFVIDGTDPEVKVEYEKSLGSVILENITFGYYNAPVEVKITTTDNISGINRFVYKCLQEGVVVDTEEIQVADEGTYVYTFEINPMFRGQVSVTAYNNSGLSNSNDLKKEPTLVIDGDAPKVSISYDNNDVVNGKYFKANRTATIIVEDDNFDADRVNFDVTAVDENGNKPDMTYYEEYLRNIDNWTKKGNTYTATVTFDMEADYVISFSCTDMAENPNADIDYGESEAPTEFTIDKTLPQVSVSFDNNDVDNGKYFKANRTATIKVSEHNFDLEHLDNVNLTVTAVDNNGNRMTGLEEQYLNRLRKAESWSHNGNVHTAKLTFKTDADYTFDIVYTDMAGNESEATDYGNSEAPNEFTVDKTKPVVTVSFYNNSADNGKYFKANRTATINVSEHNFDLENLERAVLTVTAVDSEGKRMTELEQEYVQRLQSAENWIKDGDSYTAKLVFKDDADYTFDFGYTDMAGNECTDIDYGESAAPKEFTVDKTKPAVKVSYNNNSADNGKYFKANRIATVKITEHNFNLKSLDRVKLSITAENNEGDRMTELEEHYAAQLQKSESWTKDGDAYTAQIEFANDADYTFDLTYTDMAGNECTDADYGDSAAPQEFTVDKTKPAVKVSYNNNAVDNGKYFKADRTATINVEEHNFNMSDFDRVDIKVTAKDRNGNNVNVGHDYSAELKKASAWTKSGNIYTAKLIFDEDAYYTFDFVYTDMAGNVSGAADYGNSKAPTDFAVDKTKPVINVSYNNNSVRNGDKFKAGRTATIKITEHNFNMSDLGRVDVKVTAKDASGKNVDAGHDYSSELKKASAWKQNGDVYTASLKFEKDAEYTFSIAYTDMAGNKSGNVNYGSSKAPDKFTVDTAEPTGSVTIGSWSWDNTLLSDFTFSRWSNLPLDVKLTSNDTLSGLDTVEYLKTQSIYNLTQLKNASGWTGVKTYSDGFTVSPNERSVIYVHIVDKAGNEKYISSDGVILDDKAPVMESVAPQIRVTPGKNTFSGVYNSDVDINVEVVDPAADGNVYSGLRSVTYEVVNMGQVTQTGTLFDYRFENPKAGDLVQTYSQDGCIKVSSAQNNSNDVTVRVTAVDNAGNTAVASCDIKIDITKPKIRLSYNNNSAQNNEYFKADRTATIEVTERNFSADDVKLSITNTDGSVPSISSWSKSGGSGNGDNAVWSATLRYTADGDYTFDVSCADAAGNPDSGLEIASGTVAAKKFTIDKTKPVLKVEYSNSDVQNGNYYKAERTADITITEHNFNADSVKITVEAELDGKKITAPKAAKWETSGDVHKTSIPYTEDGLYTFKISYTDTAGNDIDTYPEDKFYVDKTAPEVTISGIKENSANKGEVAPVITFSDINFSSDSVKITLKGANRGDITELKGSFSETEHGTVFTFDNFEQVKDIDDIYTLTAVTTDKAGNSSSQEIKFSVNRFGSTYELSDSANSMNGSFVKDPTDITITEVNANKLNNVQITLFKNDKTIVLKEGTDYTVTEEGGNGAWYKYTYNIFKKNFEDDGVYRISVHSEDEAGNVAENTLDTKDKEISFAVDKTAPDIVITNLEDGKTYPVEKKEVKISVTDNIQLSSVSVYLDDELLKTWSEAEVKQIVSGNGDFIVEIDDSSNSAHTLKVVGVDSAGNESESEVKNFYVTTNFWVRFYNNKAAFFGTIAGIILLAALIIFLIIRRKKRR
ncbi:MAG: hypothetical protein J5994_01420 [Ruminococcus sp.]|nr:hypothetical protein [Ruminococcus sp.]